MSWSLILLFLMGQSCFINSQLYEYRYIRENKNWAEAQQYCRKNHTDLATVTNMTDMKRLLNVSAGSNSQAWIGLYDQTDGQRTWYWTLPGEEFNENETNWKQGEPNDGGGGTYPHENCGFLFESLNWGDANCNNPSPFVCYNETNGTHEYHLIKEQKTWQKAQSYCRENYTDLLSGIKQLQDEGLRKVMNSTSSYPFFGLFRDTWRWSDGSSFSFRDWNNDFNNQQPNSGQCAVTKFDSEGRWTTDSCTVRKPFICYDDKVILIKKDMTWKDALYYCRDNYNGLVTITNLDEQRWVQEKAKNASTNYVWMGLRYNCSMNVWYWVCEKWVMNMNLTSDGQKDVCNMYGAMDAGGEHRWFQRNGSERFNFFCSINSSSSF